MPERPPDDDPFADLGPDYPREGSAAERFAHEDEVNPEPDDPRANVTRPQIPNPGNKYAWAVGIIGLMGVSVLLFTTAIPNQGEGIKGPELGRRLPVFAAPLASGNADDKTDSNVYQSRKGAEKEDDAYPCDIESESVMTACELREGPTVMTMVVPEGTDCEPQVDRVERVKGDFPDVKFVTVMGGEKRSEAERIANNRGWTQPVGVDKDGAVMNLYGIGVCPTTIFADERGIVRKVDLGNLTEDELRERVRDLTRPKQNKGVRGPKIGAPLPTFAAPLASSDIEDSTEANVYQTPAQAKRNGGVYPCDIEADVLNSCDLRKGPAVTTVIVSRNTNCDAQVDRADAVRSEFPGVAFSAVAGGEKRSSMGRVAKERSWGLPVGVDKDGAVLNLLGVGVCPTTIFSDERGIVRDVALGNLSQAELRARVRKLRQ